MSSASESITESRRDGTSKELLRSSRVVVAPETFSLVSVSHTEFSRLLHNSDLSPRGAAPFMIFSDKHEVTLVLDEIDFEKLRSALGDAKVARQYRMLTFDIELDLNIVGFLAEVSRILAGAEVPVIALSSFSRDHLLIRQGDLARALKSLGPHVSELCS